MNFLPQEIMADFCFKAGIPENGLQFLEFKIDVRDFVTGNVLSDKTIILDLKQETHAQWCPVIDLTIASIDSLKAYLSKKLKL